ncbi:MAG: hypothetical protein QMC36_04910 [Patescibacteria group bacterium]
MRSQKEAATERTLGSVFSVVRSFAKKVAGIVGKKGSESPFSFKEAPVSDMEASDKAFFARLGELRDAAADQKYAEAGRVRLSRRLDGIESAHASGAFPYVSDWGAVMEEASDLLVDVSPLRAEVCTGLSEAELADLTDSETRLSYYRTLSLAQEALSDPEITREHSDTLVSMLKREASRIRANERVRRTLGLRASFTDFRKEIESMDLRDYSIDSLKALSIHFKAVIEASKDEAGAESYDAAVSTLFRSFSDLVPLRALRDAVSEIESLSSDRKFRLRWDVSRYADVVAESRKALSNPSVTKAEIDALTLEAHFRLAELRTAKSRVRELDDALVGFSGLKISDYSKGSYAAIPVFVEKCALAKDPASVGDLVLEAAKIRDSLVGVRRLRKAMFAAHRIVSSKDFRTRNPEASREAVSRLEFACDLLERPGVKRHDVNFVAASLESFASDWKKPEGPFARFRSRIADILSPMRY